MKILHICALSVTAEGLLKPQIDYFLSRNVLVEIACSPGVEAERLQQQGYVIHPIQIDRRISLLPNFKSIYNMVKLMVEKQYDLVHVHTPIAAVLGRVAAKLAGVKRIVYTAHGFPFYEQSPPLEYAVYFNIEKFAALFTDLILTQNYEDVATAKQKGLCSREKIAYLGNGIDIDRFKCDRLSPSHQKQLRDSLNIPATANLIVGTVGRLTRKKGSAYLIEAAASLLPQFPHLHILIIGPQLSTDPEPFQTELIAKIRTLGLEDRVTLTGKRQDIPELLGLLDIFVLPTFHNEGLPRSILEAMAMNLPVIATDIRGCREAVIHEKTGLIVPSQNSEKLAEALAKLLSDPKLRKAYGLAGRQRVEAEYDERFVFQRLEELYQELGIEFLRYSPAANPV
ncbi:glycosyltransferase family 4 protein [Phormidium sp. LEGE 05292]|uniref:glycosyltransferase family 4 protein n=1 Tax=[Phormidium] sp. LEGE 05292 TaxID=767427 RepID=UPI0018810DA2|nr:glycosyltransferase family 4 protein [Phormidium sp. LEGE 05292]MBE9223911.1 glycosyltransferase family 4 protein [Phormidium sp. LEGE 05292]